MLTAMSFQQWCDVNQDLYEQLLQQQQQRAALYMNECEACDGDGECSKCGHECDTCYGSGQTNVAVSTATRMRDLYDAQREEEARKVKAWNEACHSFGMRELTVALPNTNARRTAPSRVAFEQLPFDKEMSNAK